MIIKTYDGLIVGIDSFYIIQRRKVYGVPAIIAMINEYEVTIYKGYSEEKIINAIEQLMKIGNKYIDIQEIERGIKE